MLSDEQIDMAHVKFAWVNLNCAEHRNAFARAIESAACAERDARIAELEANEKVLLAQVQGHTKWREKIIKASEQAYGESAIRYKFSLTKNGKCMNTFPKEIDGRWFALVPADDDGHIGHIARIAELTRELEEARKDAELLDYIQTNGATVEIIPGTPDFYPVHFRVGGRYRTANENIRDAIRAAIKEQT